MIEQAMLEGKELSIEVVEGGGLLIRPVNKARAGWAEQIQTTLQNPGRFSTYGLSQGKVTVPDF